MALRKHKHVSLWLKKNPPKPSQKINDKWEIFLQLEIRKKKKKAGGAILCNKPSIEKNGLRGRPASPKRDEKDYN